MEQGQQQEPIGIPQAVLLVPERYVHQEEFVEGQTELHRAILDGDTKVNNLARIVQHVKINAQDAKGNTALHYAADKDRFNPNRYHEISFLLAKGANPLLKNHRGETPGDLEDYRSKSYQRLRQAEIDWQAKEAQKQKPEPIGLHLHVAQVPMLGNVEQPAAAQQLAPQAQNQRRGLQQLAPQFRRVEQPRPMEVQTGPINQEGHPEQDAERPLAPAPKRPRIEQSPHQEARVLAGIDEGPLPGREPQEESVAGQTELHRAILYGDSKMGNLRRILENSVKISGNCNIIDVQDAIGNTALHYAASGHLYNSITFLIHFEANPTLLNNRGQAPRDLSDRHSKSFEMLYDAEQRWLGRDAKQQMEVRQRALQELAPQAMLQPQQSPMQAQDPVPRPVQVGANQCMQPIIPCQQTQAQQAQQQPLLLDPRQGRQYRAPSLQVQQDSPIQNQPRGQFITQASLLAPSQRIAPERMPLPFNAAQAQTQPQHCQIDSPFQATGIQPQIQPIEPQQIQAPAPAAQPYQVAHPQAQQANFNIDELPLIQKLIFENISAQEFNQLLASGAIDNINVIDRNGDTAAHHAVRLGRTDLLEILMEYGANLEIINNRGETPLILFQQKIRSKTTIGGSESFFPTDTTAGSPAHEEDPFRISDLEFEKLTNPFDKHS